MAHEVSTPVFIFPLIGAKAQKRIGPKARPKTRPNFAKNSSRIPHIGKLININTNLRNGLFQVVAESPLSVG